jgi:hypothetical protein
VSRHARPRSDAGLPMRNATSFMVKLRLRLHPLGQVRRLVLEGGADRKVGHPDRQVGCDSAAVGVDEVALGLGICLAVAGISAGECALERCVFAHKRRVRA